MTTLPVREMVLYKHGVGFFVREGAVEGESVALTFRQDEINDVLKSLAVFDKAGGQVLGIHYQTPMDKAARLASSSIRLSDSASLRDLLTGLRGREVKLEVLALDKEPEFFSGRMLGIDDFVQEQEYVRSRERRVSLLVHGYGVLTFDWLAVRAVQILDAQADHDLTYFLDTSMSEDARRTVNVRLSAGAHDLAVYYVAPSPTWRVSYRLVAEADEGGQSGKALLQGWGLFDNRLEEDLEDVQVTLVAGQPISFIYDLYASRIPARPTVQDEARIAPGPVEYAGAYSLPVRSDVSQSYGKFSDDMPSIDEDQLDDSYSPRQQSYSLPFVGTREPRFRAGLATSNPIVAVGKDAGEYFEYRVTTPVSVKRGDSAVVPILSSEVGYQRELLYNGSKLPHHPVVALRFENTSGLMLERGPVTIIENGVYIGEVMIGFTRQGSQIYLPYAVELGVRIIERRESVTEATSLTVHGDWFFDQYQISKTTYLVENSTANPLEITIEVGINAGWELFDTSVSNEVSGIDHRWKVKVASKNKTELVIKQRQPIYQRRQVVIRKRWWDWLRKIRLTQNVKRY